MNSHVATVTKHSQICKGLVLLVAIPMMNIQATFRTIMAALLTMCYRIAETASPLA